MLLEVEVDLRLYFFQRHEEQKRCILVQYGLVLEI